ncbi:MAG: hypothetical protein M5U28_27030 [Sandaracinaceae bacterium]|nr:hypothetical protein [Sandaracinaceae bacterium]
MRTRSPVSANSAPGAGGVIMTRRAGGPGAASIAVSASATAGAACSGSVAPSAASTCRAIW